MPLVWAAMVGAFTWTAGATEGSTRPTNSGANRWLGEEEPLNAARSIVAAKTLTSTGMAGSASLQAAIQAGPGGPSWAAATAGTVITKQPTGQSATVGFEATLSVEATGTGLTYQWYRGGRPVGGNSTATSPSLGLNIVSTSNVGIYDCVISAAGSSDVLSEPAIFGVFPAPGNRSAGSVTTKTEWLGMHHSNGNVYDQFLLYGSAGTFTSAPGRIARLSFLDSKSSITQVELSGAGAATVVLDNAAGPFAPTLYNQTGIRYVQGDATIIVVGADETTHLSIYTVGPGNNPAITRNDVTYDGWAHVVVLGILTANGRLGGLHLGDAIFAATVGPTGIFAPSVSSVEQMPIAIHDIKADGTAQPYLYFGSGSQARIKIAGGNLAQTNHSPITVAGLLQVLMGAGLDSVGNSAPAQINQGVLALDDGTIVTGMLVAGP